MLAFQFPPHHRRTRSPPHSSYSALLTATRCSSSVCANAAIPRHASNDGSAARTMRSGISGGRIGRSVACSRSARPGICAGEPVRKTFCDAWSAPWSWEERRVRSTAPGRDAPGRRVRKKRGRSAGLRRALRYQRLPCLARTTSRTRANVRCSYGSAHDL